MTREYIARILNDCMVMDNVDVISDRLFKEIRHDYEKVLIKLDTAREDYPDRYGFDGGIRTAREIFENHIGDMYRKDCDQKAESEE